MKWDFTYEQVAKGEIDYTLQEFRKDYFSEVKDNFDDYDPEQLDAIFSLAYDVCYCTSIRQDLNILLKHCGDKGLQVDIKYLELIRDSNLENIEMLKAIFAKKVSEFMDEGLDAEASLKKLEEYHSKVIAD